MGLAALAPANATVVVRVALPRKEAVEQKGTVAGTECSRAIQGKNRRRDVSMLGSTRAGTSDCDLDG